MYLVHHYFWIFDDAFVYLRYVDNLVILKRGLVYNQGEYVEGFSSPFYVILLGLFRALDCDYLDSFRIISSLSFTLFWLMLVKLNRHLSPPSAPVINFPLIYLCLNYGVLTYFSSGMETPLVQVIAVAYALYIVNPSSAFLQTLLAVSPLIRHELIVPLGLCSVWTWFYHKKLPVNMLLLAFVLGASWMAFRIYYYADLFPVTFYLKDVVWFEQGLKYLHQTFASYHYYSVFGIFLILGLLLKKRGAALEWPTRLMMVCVAVPVTLYVLKIGGDSRHYRYLAFPFCVSVCALGGVLEHAVLLYCPQRLARLSPVAGILIASLVFSFYPPQLDRHPISRDVKHKIKDGILESAIWRGEGVRKGQAKLLATVHEKMKKLSEEGRGFEYKETIASGICRANYVWFNSRCIHAYGLTDGILARVKMRSEKAGQKEGLKPLARDMVAVHDASERIGKGMYRRSVEQTGGPSWVSKNLQAIEVVESKIYNEHDFLENLKAALSFPRRIVAQGDLE